MQAAAALNWQEVRLTGNSAHEYSHCIEELASALAYGWQTKPSPKSGNPTYIRPSVLVIYREDHKFLLDAVIPKPGRNVGEYDLIIASQPWRARMSAAFKAQKVLGPLARSLAPGGAARDQSWATRRDRQGLAGREPLQGRPPPAARGPRVSSANAATSRRTTDDKAIFRYVMHAAFGITDRINHPRCSPPECGDLREQDRG